MYYVQTTTPLLEGDIVHDTVIMYLYRSVYYRIPGRYMFLTISTTYIVYVVSYAVGRPFWYYIRNIYIYTSLYIVCV